MLNPTLKLELKKRIKNRIRRIGTKMLITEAHLEILSEEILQECNDIYTQQQNSNKDISQVGVKRSILWYPDQSCESNFEVTRRIKDVTKEKTHKKLKTPLK